MAAVIGVPQASQLVEALGCKIRILVSAEQTGGLWSIVGFEVPPGFLGAPALHRHLSHDWQGVVVEGEITLDADRKETVLTAGMAVFVPRLTLFRWKNRSAKPARWVMTYSPGGFEKYYVDLATALKALGRPAKAADLSSVGPLLWKRYGLEPSVA